MSSPTVAERDVVLAITTLPPDTDARAFVRDLLDAGLVACGTLLPQAESVFRWEGQVEVARETLVWLKTTGGALPLLREHLLSHHPYTLPELLVFPAADGLPAYLDWVREEVARR